MLVFHHKDYNHNLCIECLFSFNFFDWCKKCKLKHFQLNYGEFPSENNDINHFLEDNYCESRSPEELIEWIPYNEFKDVTYIADNKETYNALWSKGCIYEWDKEKFNWSRKIKKVKLVNKYELTDFIKVNYNIS
jgi:hypothetical protein